MNEKFCADQPSGNPLPSRDTDAGYETKAVRLTRRDRLADSRNRLDAKLARINAAIAALDSAPYLAELLDLVESV